MAIRPSLFDAYGTPFDFASAAAQCTELAADQRGPLTALWRDKQLQHTWRCALQRQYEGF